MARQEEGQRLLAALGLAVRGDWAAAASAHLATEERTYATWPDHRRSDALFAQFLHADLNQIGAGSLPPGLQAQAMHKQKIVGRHVLQVDELLDIAKANRERYADASGSRCLKMSLTDGLQRVVAIEYRPITALSSGVPAGLKIAVTDAFVKRGVMLLRPENVVVLGGQVERLERARQAMLAYWSRPLGGRPRPQQTGARPPSGAEERAAMGRAAWAWESDAAAATAAANAQYTSSQHPPNGQQPRVAGPSALATTSAQQSAAAAMPPPPAPGPPPAPPPHTLTAAVAIGRGNGQAGALGKGSGAEAAGPRPVINNSGDAVQLGGLRTGAGLGAEGSDRGIGAPVLAGTALLPVGTRGRLSLSQSRLGGGGAPSAVAGQAFASTQPSQNEDQVGSSGRGGSESPIFIDVTPERRRGAAFTVDEMDIDTGPAPLASSTSAPSTASGSQPAGNSQRSGGGGAGQAGQRLTGTPLVTLRALSARARALPLGQKLRPRPLHALLAGIEGRLRYRDAEERPLQQYQFEVYLDDGSAKQRCRVASEVVQRWLQGVDAPGLAAMSESARNVAVSKLKQFLMKAEGMWALEFNGGTGSFPLVVDMTPGLDGQLVAALRARCRLYYPSIS